MGYVLDALPESPPIFSLIQQCGGVTDAEMCFTYNMGIGFCAVVSPRDVDAVHEIARNHSLKAHTIGFTIKDPEKAVKLTRLNLVGREGKFSRS